MNSAFVSSLFAVGMLAFTFGCASGDPSQEASAAGDTLAGSVAEPLRAPPASINPCAAALCPVNTVCEVVDGSATCTPDPSVPSCGGFAGKACPGSGSCVDNPNDNCDPTQSGADCAGLCECNIRALCVQGSVFDPSPSVCACVPAPPPEPSGPFCGGIAGIACPGAGSCVDNPNDSCDPTQGGADCGGICECNIRALCVQGSVFNPAPDVCACVPAPETDACSTARCAAGSHCVSQGKHARCIRDRRPHPRECITLD